VGGQCAPQVVDLALQVLLALLLAQLLLGEREPGRALVAVHAEVHQGVAGVEQQLDGFLAVALLALGDVVPREQQVVDDGVGVGPGAEQVVALEEAVVAVGGVGDHQALHGERVLLHQVGDAGVGVDHDLVGQAHLPALVPLLGGEEVLAEGPVVVVDRHAHRGVGVHHLLGGDDLDLHRVGVELVVRGGPGDLLVVAVDGLDGPFRAGG